MSIESEAADSRTTLKLSNSKIFETSVYYEFDGGYIETDVSSKYDMLREWGKVNYSGYRVYCSDYFYAPGSPQSGDVQITFSGLGIRETRTSVGDQYYDTNSSHIWGVIPYGAFDVGLDYILEHGAVFTPYDTRVVALTAGAAYQFFCAIPFTAFDFNAHDPLEGSTFHHYSASVWDLSIWFTDVWGEPYVDFSSSHVGDKVEEGNQLQEEGNKLQEESNETQKGILGKITDFFGSFFKNLIDSVISLFVPSAEEMSGLFDQLNQFFSDRFGFLYAPFEYIIKLLNVFVSADGATALTFPGFSIMGEEVWPDITYDLAADPLVGKICGYVQMGTGVLLAGYFIMFLQDFFKERFGSG